MGEIKLDEKNLIEQLQTEELGAMGQSIIKQLKVTEANKDMIVLLIRIFNELLIRSRNNEPSDL